MPSAYSSGMENARKTFQLKRAFWMGICLVLAQLVFAPQAAAKNRKKIVRISLEDGAQTVKRAPARGPGSTAVRLERKVKKVRYTRSPEQVVVEPLAKNANTKNLGLPEVKKKVKKKPKKKPVLQSVAPQKNEPKPPSAAELARRQKAEFQLLQQSSEKDLLADYGDL